jgi:type I restriction enzyme S subunit
MESTGIAVMSLAPVYYFLSVKDIVGGRLIYDGARQITQQDFLETHRRTNLSPGDVMFTNTGTIGRMAIAPDDPKTYRTTFQKSVAILKPRHEIVLPRFLYYLLIFENTRLSEFAAGTTQKNLLLRDFRSFSVRLPDLDDQRAISQILGTLDDKIDLSRRLNETLEAIARALFRSWFVDFDAVRAKQEGRQPPGLDAAIAALFPASFEDSPLGPIPAGWKVVPLPESIEVNPPRRLAPDAVAPYLDMGNMPTRGHRPDSWIERPFGSGMRFINGDTLVARITPCLENGKTAFVDFLGDGLVGWGSTEYIVLRPKAPLPAEYGYFLARTDEFRTFAIQNMSGSSGRQRVPAECFGHYFIVVPNEAVAAEFGRQASGLMAKSRNNSAQSQTLAALRDALLPKLLSGEIRVNEADRLATSGSVP